MKRIFLPVVMLLCCVISYAQQPEGIEELRMAPRTNVITYDDENAIEHLRYDESPYYVSLMGDWEEERGDNGTSYSQEFEFPRDWKAFRVFFRFMASPGYGLFVGDKMVGVSHDGRAITEFDITDLLRFGKDNRLSLRFVGDDEGSLLECGDKGLTGDCSILIKPNLNVQDFTLVTGYDPQSSTGSYSLDANLFNYKKKGKSYLEIELWDTKGHQVDKVGKWCFFDQRNEINTTISGTLADVLPWSAETPRLYTAVIRLYDEGKNLQDVVGTRFGFRTITNGSGLTVNGKAITIKGIILNDLPSPLSAGDVKMLRSQMAQMKCNNINAIRTRGHGPEDAKFYELCDELGFYVFCEANLCPRSSMGQVVATDNEYSDLFVSHVRSLYEQYKNHTSIVAWSLGQSPDNGVCMMSAYRALKQLDEFRPVIYSGAQYAENTDLIVPLNANMDLLRQHLAKQQTRSLVMLSFGNTDGNGFGGMQPLWQMVLDHTVLQGGFIDCVSWSELAQKPYLPELKQLYRPFDVQLTSTSADAAEFEISNLCDFRSLSDYRMDYVICTNLKSNIVSGDITMSLKPGETKDFKLKIPKLTLYAGEELFIQFTLRQRNNTNSIPKNTILYFIQFQLPSDNMPKQALSEANRQPIQIDRDSAHIVKIYNNDFSLLFNDSLGTITGMSYRGSTLFNQPLRLSFMRRPSLNDLDDPNGFRQWQRNGLDRLQGEVVATNIRKIDQYTIGIDVLFRYGNDKDDNLLDVRQTYLVLHSGDVLLSNDITLSEMVKTVARVGVEVPLSPTLDTLEWFGRNIESYPDRCSAGRISQQSVPVKSASYRSNDNQHWGNHTETRWLAVRNAEVGLYADIIDTFCHFSITSDTLHVDYRITGVGGAKGGMNLDESMLVKDRHYQFVLHLRPFDCMEYNAQDFRRITYPRVVSGIIEMPVITKNRDRFDGPMQVSIHCSTPKAQIHYTLDGSVPNEKSPLYTKPFTIQKSVMVRARAFKKGEAPSFVASQQFIFDYIVSCTFGHKPNTPYNKNASRALFDGEFGDVNDLSHGWLGFSGHDIKVDLELGTNINLSNVLLRFAHVPDAWVFAPAEVSVSVSSDGNNYSEPIPALITFNASDPSMNTTQLQAIKVPVNQDNIRFVRITAKPIKRIPDWHRAKGLNPWMMIDEIEIEEVLTK
ncbi:MAG: chitobiase/beta-hexosaminidase C-terminal domain-containing protein [Bacteroidales bacterium]|nr:chitobiase/beta-hexosaminidase C-terminal domain-containing protein [Bacteroidales bacterium]